MGPFAWRRDKAKNDTAISPPTGLLMSFSVITRQEGRVGRITLNRANSRHALNLEMIETIMKALVRWNKSDEIEMVLVDHVDGSVGFCAGRDVRALAKSGRSSGCAARAHLQAVYRLFHAIATYTKPYVAIMDGPTSGHGIGLSINGPIRVATERTAISFPETGYGATPDSGATRFLAGLPCELGTWLALTGAPLVGEDVVAARFATHYCPVSELYQLKCSLTEHGVSALDDYAVDADPFSIDYLSEMQRFFRGDCVNTIRGKLGRGGAWAIEQARKIDAKSPLSSKIALRQLRTGRFLGGVDTALKIEYRILSRLVGSQNFQEGVRAKHVDKDHCPHWRPYSLNRVTNDMVEKYFSPLHGTELDLQTNSQLISEPA